ncbi:ARM repeat superfamily protein [Euphorbia peplus]|nr:ARM repeat superfamily protein [Euphorbia peplus]
MANVRRWRTAFLTLRDETLTSSPSSIPLLLRHLIFSHSTSLLSSAPDLPPNELTSDLFFLMELLSISSQHLPAPDLYPTFSHLSSLINDICKSRRLSLQLNASSSSLLLRYSSTLLQFFLPHAPADASTVKPALQCLQTLRRLFHTNHQNFSPSQNIEFVKFLLGIGEFCHAQLLNSSCVSCNPRSVAASGMLSGYNSLCDVLTLIFSMLGEIYIRFGPDFPADIWQSTIEVHRKFMDALAAKNSLLEDLAMSRFLTSLLNTLHLVLMDPKGSLLEQVSGFLATLRILFTYGLSNKPLSTFPTGGLKENELSANHLNLTLKEPIRKDRAPYRPPHLRKKDSMNTNQPKSLDSICISDRESDFTSSDSDCSDSDGMGKDTDTIQSSKVRVAAIQCIQDLCQADPKSFTTHWTMLLPTNDVLQPRKSEATLMTCLLFDPCLKVRLASASTLAEMLDGPSSVFLQVAEYKESTRWGSFMALSSSLGSILMQLHTGVLYLIQHETYSRMLPSLFKILVLLIASTPYSRMPEELLPTVVTSLLSRTKNGFPFKSDQTTLLATTINCLTAAFSKLPPSQRVKQMLSEEISVGLNEAEKRSGVISMLFQHSGNLTNSTICVESLQALRALIHNHPNIAVSCWERVSSIFSKILRVATPEIHARSWKCHAGEGVGFAGEKVITAAIKVLDECLRALSGFRGTEDLDESAEDIKEEPKAFESGSEHWSTAIEKHLPLILFHTSPMVRTASVTCFAGITSSVFTSLSKEKQEFIVSSLINAAINDDVPSVRSATCRAIGVISCFPQISHSAEILARFIHAVEINTHDPLVSVRITASWASANICDSVRHCVNNFPLENTTDLNANPRIVELLAECALRLAKDGDKIKSNAVRALGNLSRFMRSHSNKHAKPAPPCTCLMERTVQAFLSCVTTGNVKVQWNVCHALSNLFLNETLRLQDMDWAPSVFSILLLLLRDSSNFKIRIQAAAALAVPASVQDYGKSFSDVVQGLEHLIENPGSDQMSTPSSFRYRVALDKQITSTMLHVLSLAWSTDHQPLRDFLVKKAPYLEEWLKAICSSLGEARSRPEASWSASESQKKQMISKAICSLIQVYESKNHRAIAQKFEKLGNHL